MWPRPSTIWDCCDVQRAHRLYTKILAPAAAFLDGAQQLFVVPDGALESLPPGVLVTTAPEHEPEGLADHRAIAWLAREHALTVLPTVGSLRALRQFAAGGEAPAPFVGIGDPILVGKPKRAREVKTASLFRGAMADVEAVRLLPP